MKQCLKNYINHKILNEARNIRYIVKSEAPSCEKDLFNCGELVIWSGASDNTIFQDEKVNFAFRALHDALHLKTGMNFSPENEIELGRIQASRYDGILADLVYCEVSLQAKYFLNNGVFVQDQVLFAKQNVKGLYV